MPRKVSGSQRTRVMQMHALKLFHVDGMDATAIKNEMKLVSVQHAENLIEEGIRAAGRRIDSEIVAIVREEIAEEHRACIRALQFERDAGGPVGRDGAKGIAATCRAISGHLVALANLYDANARRSLASDIIEADPGDVNALRKAYLAALVSGEITPAALTAASKMLDALDTEVGDKYQKQGATILKMVAAPHQRQALAEALDAVENTDSSA